MKDAGIIPEKGFIKLPRALLSEAWALNPQRLALFVHLLAMANREAKEWNGIFIERGQAITSLRTLSTSCGLTISQVRTALKCLSQRGVAHLSAHLSAHPQQGNVAHLSAQGYTVVTINNFDSYEGEEVKHRTPSRTPQSESPAHPSARSSALTKEYIYNYLLRIEKEESYRNILLTWYDYKISQGEKPETLQEVADACKRLRECSDNNPNTAQELVSTAIRKGWRNFYAPKPKAAAPSTPAARPRDPRFFDPTDQFQDQFI